MTGGAITTVLFTTVVLLAVVLVRLREHSTVA